MINQIEGEEMMGVEKSEIAEGAMETLRAYLRTYANPRPYPNVTKERSNLRYSLQRDLDEFDDNSNDSKGDKP